MSTSASGYESGSTNVPKNVTDGDLNTRWSCLGKGSWIQLDLGNDVQVSEVLIAWYAGNTRKSNFAIDITNNSGSTTRFYSGTSSGLTQQLEKYAANIVLGRFVKITVNGNNVNDWASITEVQILGPAITQTPTPPPPPTPSPPSTAPTLDENGVKMIYATDTSRPSYFYKMSDSIEDSKYIKTDRNTSTQKTEGNITFKRLAGNDVTYASGAPPGKTVRVNLNAGGFISTQAHTWKDSGVSYLWTPADSKNAEFTYYARVTNAYGSHSNAGSKMRSGIHTSSNDPRASCFDIEFKVGQGDSSLQYALEYNHPDYHYSSTTKKSSNLSAAGKWFGRKTICWNGKADGKVHVEDYVDWSPFDSTGKPANNWTLLQTQTITGDSTYNKVPTWGGMWTYRQDGFQYVDIAIISIREILPPT